MRSYGKVEIIKIANFPSFYNIVTKAACSIFVTLIVLIGEYWNFNVLAFMLPTVFPA